MKSLATNNIDGRTAHAPSGVAPLLTVHARHPHRRSTKAMQATAMSSAAHHGSRIVSYCLDKETLMDLGGIVVVTGALLIYGVLQVGQGLQEASRLVGQLTGTGANLRCLRRAPGTQQNPLKA